MIKSTILNLITVLNRLDRESDTILMIDWNTRNIFLSQYIGNVIQCNEFWILLNNLRDKGRTYDIISSDKLNSLKYSLIKYANNSDSIEVVPSKTGFCMMAASTILYKGDEVITWVRDCKYEFRTNPFIKFYLKLTSKYYRDLMNHLSSVDLT